jgi:TorA maturation chaperone TorD
MVIAAACALPRADDTELAQDLRSLAWLHAAERDASTWLTLHRAGFPLGLHLAGGEGSRAMTQALEALREAQSRDPQGTDDQLAADFAGIYLTHAFRASPCESVWRDEDHLMLQAPTFAVREVYRRHGIPPLNWRVMPEDHLVHELCFIAQRLEAGDRVAAADFLGRHLLTWLPQFAARVAQRADTPIYAALALLTMDAATLLRQRLVDALPGDALDPRPQPHESRP